MHYYQHHIGDFIRDTSRLTDAQAMAYLRLLWMYYDTEQPLPNTPAILALKIGCDEAAVTLLLGAFFKLSDGIWRHDRCDIEIQKYHDFIESQRAKGALGGRPKKSHGKANENPQLSRSEPDVKPNQQPLTINQSNTLRGSRLPADWKPTKEDAIYCKQARPDLDIDRVADDFRDYWCSVAGSKGVKLDWSATWRGWVRKQFAQGKKKAEEVREWYETASGVDAKATELGQPLCATDEQFPAYRARIMKAEKVGTDGGFKTVAELWDMAQARKKA